ncbi:MAG: vitamin K epoxide reductase family protein [Mycobacteriaceae bacterium]|nr:vitamin K epoxide reductase family protein [Mycobacteriaceae bacterium]MBV9640458.1 vitamin K epoxide reductase family protein [Mycobacteriaceae bacterium]
MTVAAPASVPAAEPPAGAAARRSRRSAGWWVLIAGGVGLAASLALTIEKVKLLTDAHYVPSCSLNPVLSCGSVMSHWQAQVFGFPNPLIGIVAFTVVVVTGVLAVAGVPLPRWYWAGLAAGTLLGVGFIHWLIFESLYRIDALCPYCMVVWAVSIPLLVVVSSIALQPLAGNAVARNLYRVRWSLVALWFTVVILLILVRFWGYWSTLVQ